MARTDPRVNRKPAIKGIFTAAVTTGTNRDGTPTLDVRFTVKYTDDYEDQYLFTAIQSASFTWNPKERSFSLDPRSSQISEDAIWGIFGDGPDGLLEHQYFNLLRLASSKRQGPRRWLVRFLDRCGDTQKQAALLDFLKRTERKPGVER